MSAANNLPTSTLAPRHQATEHVRCGTLLLVARVDVEIHRRADPRVPETLGDHLDRHAARQHQRGVRMADVVQADGVFGGGRPGGGSQQRWVDVQGTQQQQQQQQQ